MAQVCEEDTFLLRLSFRLALMIVWEISDCITESSQVPGDPQWRRPQPYSPHLCCIAPTLPSAALCLPAAAFTEAILLPGCSDPCH